MAACNSSLDGKVVLITGGARRVGAEIARTMHGAGACVLIHYQSSERAAAELERLGKSLRKIQQEIARARAKLDNENFVRSAPAAVVTQEQERLADFQARLAGLERQLTQVRKLGNP